MMVFGNTLYVVGALENIKKKDKLTQLRIFSSIDFNFDCNLN